MESARVNPLAILKPNRSQKRYSLQEYLQREEKSLDIFFKSIGCSINLADVYENIEFKATL